MSTFGNINIEVNNQVYVIAEDIIRRYADFWGLNRLIPNRYSCLFVAKLMVNERFGCITPDEVLYEHRHGSNIRMLGLNHDIVPFQPVSS